ncbi:MAG: tail fiber domain-containing protein, partial [Flavobacteriaceae bacterium]|nr:tail fiber domain-containing protein [Flavobacteriaceae bacterium]
TDLAAEVTRAKAAEAAIQTDVDQNEADSDAADAVLQSNIDGLTKSAVSSLNDLTDVVIDDGPWPSNAGNISYYINGSSMTNTTNKSFGNTAFGDDALSRITDGQQNTGLGSYANYQTNTGSFNTAIGYGTLFANTTGDDNVSVGNNSALRVTSGSSNVAIGSNSLNTTTIGSYNTAIGRSAKASSASANNETILGYLTTGQGTNTVTLGNSSVSAVYMAEDSGATVYAGGLNIGGTAVTSSAAELNILDGVTSTATELNILDGVTSTAAELNILDGVTSTAAELNILDGVTATATELNLIDGVTATTAEINYLDGVTSNIQTQLDNAGGASSLNELSDVKTSNQSFFIGSGQSSSAGQGAYYSVGLGTKALNSVTTGDYNTAIGQEALEKVTTSHKNTAIGAQALRYVETGENNTGIGAYAGDVLTVGSNNVVIGHNADPSANDASNQIVIGKGATGQDNNSVTLGNSSVTKVYMAEDGAAVVYANATINSSDLRFKSFIQPVNLGLQFINKLNPVSYLKMSKSQYKGEEENNESRYEYGLIAQEVDNILKETDPESSIISNDAEGFLGMDYKQLIMPLIKSVQELSEEVDRLKNEIKQLKKS